MGKSTAPELPEAVVGEAGNFAVSFAGVLDSGELIASVTDVEEQYEGTVGDLAITNKVVSTAALVINDLTVAVGKAVQFSVSDQAVANAPYTLKITITTDSTPAQTKIRYVRFMVVE